MVSNEIPLTLQTAYAELLDQAASSAFRDAFGAEGNFVSKTIKGRHYWYFESKTDTGWKQKYVGPETPELQERINHHKELKDDRSHRIALVSALVQSAYLPRPISKVGQIIAAMAEAGVFRLRGVLIGTIAYQTYSAMLGIRLSVSAIQTGDIDIAQFADISGQIEEKIEPVFEILKKTDSSFRAVPDLHDNRRTTTYQSASGLRVDFLTPNRGPDSDAPRALPALQTDAQQLRFLDYLIRDPEPAVVLYDTGIYVLVPSPQRYAVHKLIVARRRQPGSAKSNKDILQAEVLLNALSEKRPNELRAVWNEAFKRGKKWKQLMGEGLGSVRPVVRDQVLKVVGATRSIIPELDLRFARAARYDGERDVVSFAADAKGLLIRCAVSREALEDHFGADRANRKACLNAFRENRPIFESMVRGKYLSWPIEDVGQVLIKTDDVPDLLKKVPEHTKHRK